MGFKLLMAVSADGFLARGPADDMRWTGRSDKTIFRLLTLTSTDRVVLIGRRSAELMPALPDRKAVVISHNRNMGLTLEEASWAHRNAWLIGGPEIAMAAVQANLVDQAVICLSAANLGGGIPFAPLHDALMARVVGGVKVMTIADLEVHVYQGMVKHSEVRRGA